MSRRSRRDRSSSFLSFAGRLGELERYGLLALAAALVLGIAHLANSLSGGEAPFRSVAFGATPNATVLARATPNPAPDSAAEKGTEKGTTPQPARLDSPGGGESVQPLPAPIVERASGAGSVPFDFFEPPVRLPGKPAVAAPTPPGKRGDDPRRIVVNRGDTLERIAGRELGATSRWRELLLWNPGLDPKKLKPGSELSVPPAAASASSASKAATAAKSKSRANARTHDVVANETLESIAHRWYGDRSRWIDLLEANRDQLRAPTSLKSGMKIRIP